MNAPNKQEWLRDVSWGWSDSQSTPGRAGARDRFQSLTLTMTHKPTHTTVTKSSPFVPNRSDELAKLRQKMWSELLLELQETLLSRDEQAD